VISAPPLVYLAVGGVLCVVAVLLYARSPALSTSDRQLLAAVLHGREGRLFEWLGILPRAAR
jgi:hypothetical protein